MTVPLVWNTYVEEFNAKRMEVHNVFEHYGVMEDLRKAAKKYKDDKDAFAEQLRRTLMYHYWSKCEWEIILSPWPERKDFREEKIDVFDQVQLNWDVFLDYVWEHRKELEKWKSLK